MLIQADKVFVTASPLSELVWSPRKGLGLICTDTSSAETKTSLWRSMESSNIILSALECDTVGDDCGNGAMAEGTLGSMQLVPNSSRKNIMDVTSPGRMIPASVITDKQESASHEEMEGRQRTTEVSMMDINHQENEQFEDKEACISSYGNSLTNISLLDSAEKIAEKALYLRTDNDQCACSSSKPEGVRVHTENIEVDFGGTSGGVLPDIFYGGNKNNQNSEIIFLKGCDPSEKLTPAPIFGDSTHAGKSLANEENSTNKKLPPLLTNFLPLGKQCLVGAQKMSQDLTCISSNQQSSFFNRLAANGGRVSGAGASESSGKHNDHIQKSFGKKQKTGTESSEKIGNDLHRRKGKETDHGENRSSLKKRDGSHESVESCNSKEFSTAKRAWCIEPEGESSMRKRPKTMANANSLGLLFGQDSSFVNWISDVVKGFPGSVQTETALTLVPEPSDSKPGNSCPPIYFDKKESNDSKTMGFQSFVQALYDPRSKVQQTSTETECHHQEVNDSKELQITDQPSDLIGSNMVHNEEGFKLQQPAPLSILTASQCHFEQCPNTTPNSCSNESPVLEKAQNITNGHHVACNWMSSSPSIWNGSTPIGNKDAAKPNSDVPNKSSEFLPKNGGSEFPGSFWITRLCPKVIPLACSAQCNQRPNSAAESQVDNCKVHLSHPQNEDHKYVENDDKKNTMENQEHSGSPLGSCSLKGMGNDQKLKSKLSPILPSQRLRKLEPMASVFAKRLDAFKHIKTSGVVDDVLFSTVMCFFCGQMGHSLKECSEIKGSELEGLQENINSYDGTQKSSCLCIRCFQLNHWAIACPLLSKKTNHITLVNGKEVQEQPVNHTSFTTDPARHEIHSKEGLNFKFLKNVGTVMDDRTFSSVQRSIISPREQKLNGKQVILHPRQVESEGNRIIPVHDFMRRQMLDEQIRVFEGIRGLHLSRSDLVRGMDSHLSPEGFFLRVRLGKYKEGTGGSGYQVACICGELEKSNESPRSRICVNMVGLKCSIDFRFVSNNDFIEDELNAWWSATIRSGRKLPTEEELTKKLQERKKVNF